jgi:predicted nucleic acid-binding protein
VRAAGELEGFWPIYRSVADAVAPRGTLVTDAHIAALMRQHGVARIWSLDRDFRKFDGISVVNPFR